ncbi:MAG: ATP-binding protein [Bacteroidota bacterium]
MELQSLGTLLGAFLILLIGIRVYYIEEEKKVGTVFFIVTALYSWMCITWFLQGQTTDLQEAIYFRKLQAVWAFTLPCMTLTFFYFAQTYGVRLPTYSMSIIVSFLFLPGIVFYYLEWFTEYKHGTMVWVEPEGYWGLSMEGNQLATKLRGVWNFLNFGISASLTFLIYRSSKIQRERFWLLAIFIIQICSYSFSFYQNYCAPFQGKVYPVDESFTVLLTCILVGWAFSGFKLFEVQPEFAMKNIMSSMTDWLILTDENFHIKRFNPAVADAYKHLSKAIQLTPLPEILILKAKDFPVEAILALEKKGEQLIQEFEIESIDRTIVMTITPILGAWNSRKGFAFIGHDVTDYKAAQTQIENYAKNLEVSNEALEHFAHIASHDLKAPLRTISSFIDLIYRRLDADADKQTQEYLQFVKDGAIRMNQMIDGILHFSKIRGAVLKKEKVDLNKVLKKIKSNLAVLIQEKKGKIKFDTLPILVGDKAQITMLFQNLIQNALKYNQSPKARIRISCVKLTNEIIINVQDNGIGIDADKANRIFKMFKRLHTQSEIPGTGIGLAFCKMIVERHHARIWVESTPNDGANFRIGWPIDQVILEPHKKEEITS